MYMVVCSHTPDDQSYSGKEAGDRKRPETVLRLSSAIYVGLSVAVNTKGDLHPNVLFRRARYRASLSATMPDHKHPRMAPISGPT